MESLKYFNTNNKRIMVALSFALLLLVTTTLTGSFSLQIIKPAMAKKNNNLITTADIADDAVTSPKIKDGEIKTSDIADNTITGDDVSPAFMVRKTLNDDAAGNAKGWNPGDPDNFQDYSILDSDIATGPTSVDTTFVNVMLRQDPEGNINCWVNSIFPNGGGFFMECSNPPPGGAVLDYTIMTLPSNVVASSAPVSSSSSSSATLSNPFSSLGEH